MNEKLLTSGAWDQGSIWDFYTSKKTPPLELISAVACIVFCGDKVVLTRHEYRGWEYPGGHREIGETPEDAIRREVLEETGLILDNIKLIGHKKITHAEPNKHRDHEGNYPYPVAYIPYYLARLEARESTIPGSSLFSPFEASEMLAGTQHNDLLLFLALDERKT